MSDELEKLRAENAQLKETLKDIQDSFKATVNEECAPDEKHCSCVPALREKIKALRSQIENMKQHSWF